MQLRCAIIISILFLQLSNASKADEGDVFNTLLSMNYLYDSNVFRLPDGTSATSDGRRSDTLKSLSVGFKINKAYALQKFNVEYTRNENTYNSFKFLDYSSDTYKAAWSWAVTPKLTGLLGYDKSTSLAGFMDYRNFSNPNYRTTENKFATLEYSPFGNWYLAYSKSNYTLTNSQTFLADSDVEVDSNKVGVKYKFQSGSYLDLNYYDRKGNYDATKVNLFATDYSENAIESSIKYIYSGSTTITSAAGYVSRSYQGLSVRDYDSPYGSLIVDYIMSGHVTLSAGVRRDISSFSTIVSSYTENDSIYFRPLYQIGSHIALSGNMQFSKRKFKGQGIIISDLQSREDDQQTYGLTLNWYPRSTIQLGLNAQRDLRRSTTSSLNYNDDSVGISAQLLF